MRRYALEQIIESTEPFKWLDNEGASLIGTLGKVWSDDAPPTPSQILSVLVLRAQQGGAGQAAAVESCALGFAHLLPVFIKCVPRP